MEREPTHHDVIVIGASAGGVDTLQKLAARLPADLPASVLVVMHVPALHKTLLPEILNRSGPLPASEARDGERIRRGRIYVARSDHHLLVERGRLRLSRGPKENRHRPSIDVLFRSASRAYGPRVIAVVLSGRLDDGAAGALAVKKRGGLFVVQSPEDAVYDEMPKAALESVGSADYVVPREELGALLTLLSRTPAPPDEEFPVPLDMAVEDEIARGRESDAQVSALLGQPSHLSCPDCGGVLSDLTSNELLRFRCQVGHAYSAVHLFHAQESKLQEQLWGLVRSLREHALLARQIRRSAARHDWVAPAGRFAGVARRADELASQLLRQLAAMAGVGPQGPSQPRPAADNDWPSPLSRVLASVAPVAEEPSPESGHGPESADAEGHGDDSGKREE
jgi:two-component system chemotaxis response regulator CheB